MAINSYIQGESQRKDAELFGLIGRWLVDRAVHEHLGTAITSEPGDMWTVSVDSKGKAKGFLQARAMKSALHIRFVFCVDSSPLVCRTLIERATRQATESECDAIWTNDRDSAEVWSDLGFTFTPRERGQFGRWEKQL